MGFDVICCKTQRNGAFKVNNFPNVLYVDLKGDLTIPKYRTNLLGKTRTTLPTTKISITNSFGNPLRGPGFWTGDLKKSIKYQGRGQLLIMSIVSTVKGGFNDDNYYDDFAQAAAKAVLTGVGAIEINFSCPNVANENVLCYTPEAVWSISKKVKSKVGKTPLIAKFGYYDDGQITAPYLSAISAINTIAAPIVNKKGEQALPGPNRLKSRVCGAGIKWAGLNMVEKLVKLRRKLHLDFEIVGVGGVMPERLF